MKSIDLVSKSQFCKVINILLHANIAFIYYTDSHILSLNIDFFIELLFNLSEFVLLIEGLCTPYHMWNDRDYRDMSQTCTGYSKKPGD